MQTWTVLSLLNWTTEYFGKNQIPTPRLDAEVLLAYLLGCERLQLYLKFDRPMSEEELARFKALIGRRIKGEPVSYIRGLKEFWSLPFKVGPGVLVPRPETELLVDRGSRIACPPKSAGGGRRRMDREKPLRILDIGTGSGNLAIAFAKEFPQASILAIDTSEEALTYAKENAITNDVQSQIEFIKSDFLTICDLRSAIYDLIVSNPPYVPTSVWETLPAGIRDYEPRIALDAGADGLVFYHKISEIAPKILNEEGVLAVEIGEDQAKAVADIFKRVGLRDIEVIKDYAGLDRIIMTKRSKEIKK